MVQMKLRPYLPLREHPHVLVVLYEPGNLTAVTKKEGKVWASDTVVTTATPASFNMIVDPLMAANPLVSIELALLFYYSMLCPPCHISHPISTAKYSILYHRWLTVKMQNCSRYAWWMARVHVILAGLGALGA